MNDKAKLKKIIAEHIPGLYKHLFAEEPPAPVAEVKLGSGKTADGKELKWEGDLAPGTAILMISPDGDVAVPDGEWTMEDGTVIATAGGQVTVITPPAMPEMMTSEQVQATVAAAMSKQAEEFNAKINALTAQATAKESALEEKFKAIHAVFAAIADLDVDSTNAETDPKQKASTKKAQRFASLTNTINNIPKK